MAILGFVDVDNGRKIRLCTTLEPTKSTKAMGSPEGKHWEVEEDLEVEGLVRNGV